MFNYKVKKTIYIHCGHLGLIMHNDLIKIYILVCRSCTAKDCNEANKIAGNFNYPYDMNKKMYVKGITLNMQDG